MKNKLLHRVLIMAGGTGGHVFPALAIAERFMELGIRVEWLGTRKGLEARVVPAAHILMHTLSVTGVRGKNIKTRLLAPMRVLYAFLQALCIIYQFKPTIVIGMGGFVSGPGGIAAWVLRKKLIIHEQNAKLGLTNRWLSSFADILLEGFPDTFTRRRAHSRVRTVGNPVRRAIAMLQPPHYQPMPHSPLRLLVLGGSLGAQAINTILPEALARLPESERYIVCHQTGEKHLLETQLAYQKAHVTAEILPFIVNIETSYQEADMVLCRAGALTIAELCAAGKGAILIPFPYAVDDHQTANAQVMVEQGAAYLIQQADLTVDRLADLLKLLNANPERCRSMGSAAYALRQVDATEKIVTICQEMDD